MFNLKTAGIALRKAAALQGIKSGQWEPFNDVSNSKPHDVIAKVTDSERTIEITSGDVTYADHLTWSEIRSRT